MVIANSISTLIMFEDNFDHQELDWATKLLYVGIFIAAMILAAIFVFILCRLTSSEDDVDSTGNPLESSRGKRYFHRNQSDDGLGGTSDHQIAETSSRPFDQRSSATNKDLLGGGRQTMAAMMFRSAKDTDVIVASTLSAVPLKELGGKENDIIIDVSQQMHMNDPEKLPTSPSEHKCFVCKARKVTWNQVSCFAQTTVGVLVYKRTLQQQDNQTANLKPVAAAPLPSSNKSNSSGRQRRETPKLETTRLPSKSSPVLAIESNIKKKISPPIEATVNGKIMLPKDQQQKQASAPIKQQQQQLTPVANNSPSPNQSKSTLESGIAPLPAPYVDKPRTDSTLTLAPTPDSRINIADNRRPPITKSPPPSPVFPKKSPPRISVPSTSQQSPAKITNDQKEVNASSKDVRK